MANQEQLDLPAKGVTAWNRWKGDTHETLPGLRWNFQYDADLSDADLSGTDLSGVNLEKVDLSKTNFTGASLAGGSFVEAEPVEANFTSTDLSRANLSSTNSDGAKFSNADLRNADLRGAYLLDACFQNANLSDADLSQTFLKGTCFQGANLSRANLSRATLSKNCLQGANLSGANLSGIRYGTLFHYMQVRQAKEAGALVRSVNPDQQRVKKGARIFASKETQNKEIILFTRVNSRVLRGIALSFLLVVVSVWLLQTPENRDNVIIEIFAVLSSLSGLLRIFQFLHQLLNHTHLLIINDKGIEYFCPLSLKQMEQEMTREDLMLTWKEIGAIGIIKRARANSFVVYASSHRWRSSWIPSLRLSERLLPISAQQVITLIQERYQEQLEDGIIPIELRDDLDEDEAPFI